MFRRGVKPGQWRLFQRAVRIAAVDEWGNRGVRVVRVTRLAPERGEERTPAPAADDTPPIIELPAKVETAEKTAVIAGRVTDESSIYRFLVKGVPVSVGADGGFEARTLVPLGESAVGVVAIDMWGNRTERTVAVARTAPPPAPAAKADTAPPDLEVPDRIEADGRTAEIAGRVRDESAIHRMLVGGMPVAVAEDGSFRARRPVPLGTSRVRVVAIDKWDNRAERHVVVYRAPVEATAPAADASDPAVASALGPVASKPFPDLEVRRGVGDSARGRYIEKSFPNLVARREWTSGKGVRQPGRKAN